MARKKGGERESEEGLRFPKRSLPRHTHPRNMSLLNLVARVFPRESPPTSLHRWCVPTSERCDWRLKVTAANVDNSLDPGVPQEKMQEMQQLQQVKMRQMHRHSRETEGERDAVTALLDGYGY